MLKKITIFIITCLFAMTSLTGCISYWNGHSYNESKQLVADALKEKYGEEFVVAEIGTKSGGAWDAPGSLTAVCYSKNNETVYFEAEYFEYGKSSYELSDLYIQSIVRKQLKTAIEPVLAESFDDFAMEMDIHGIYSDSGIRNSNEVTVESFSEAVSHKPEQNYIVMWLILEENNIINQEEMIGILSGFTEDFFNIYATIYVCYAPKDIIQECEALTDTVNYDPKDIRKLVGSKYLMHVYTFNGNEKTVKFIKSVDY